MSQPQDKKFNPAPIVSFFPVTAFVSCGGLVQADHFAVDVDHHLEA